MATTRWGWRVRRTCCRQSAAQRQQLDGTPECSGLVAAKRRQSGNNSMGPPSAADLLPPSAARAATTRWVPGVRRTCCRACGCRERTYSFPGPKRRAYPCPASATPSRRALAADTRSSEPRNARTRRNKQKRHGLVMELDVPGSILRRGRRPVASGRARSGSAPPRNPPVRPGGTRKRLVDHAGARGHAAARRSVEPPSPSDFPPRSRLPPTPHRRYVPHVASARIGATTKMSTQQEKGIPTWLATAQRGGSAAERSNARA